MDKTEVIRLLRGGKAGIEEWNLRKQERRSEDVLRLMGESELVALDLTGVDLSGANLYGCDFRKSNLTGANFQDANLRGADLTDAVLIQANLARADLSYAVAKGAFFDGAKLHSTRLDHTDLSRSRLFGAELYDAVLADTRLHRTDLSNARLGSTIIDCSLNGAEGLASVVHRSPSVISIPSLLGLQEELPEKFLRGCGLREQEIAYFRAQVATPIRFYTCFISYSTADEAFASRLHNDFQAAGIRCWKWDHDARTGRSLWGEIDQAIRKFDKLVLIASESSLKSPAVNREIERALQQEDQREKAKLAGKADVDPDVLFPVRIDDYLFGGWDHERKADVTKKVIADARGWERDNEKYQRVLNRLLRDLKPS